MCVDDSNVQEYFKDRSPAPVVQDNAVQAAVAACLAAAQPTPTPIHVAQVSQPPVTPKEILKLKIEMNELAQQLASFNSEPFEKYLISEDELGLLDELADKKGPSSSCILFGYAERTRNMPNCSWFNYGSSTE